jgi:ankyrin repeat protein
MAKQTVSTNASSQIKSPRANFTEKLIYSATKGYLEDLISVLEQGANVDMKDELGNTALHMAAAAGHTPIVKKLLENNANVNIQNNQGNTPLHQATWRNHPVQNGVILFCYLFRFSYTFFKLKGNCENATQCGSSR